MDTSIAGDINTPCQLLTGQLDRKPARIQKNSTTPSNNRIKLTFIKLHPAVAKYTSFQVPTNCIPRRTIFWAIKQVSINVKGFLSYKVNSLTPVELNQKSITHFEMKPNLHLLALCLGLGLSIEFIQSNLLIIQVRKPELREET